MDNANRADADRPDNRSGSPLADSIASPIAITVAICTYNGANRLPEVLDALERQQLPEALKPNLEETGPNWEVLVVDNNSTDATRDVVAQYATRWQLDRNLPSPRCIHEPRQGTTYARQRAFREARGTWVGILDDDNIPPPTWLTAASSFIRQSERDRSHLGAFGGNIRPRLDAEPPAYFDRVAILLALYDRGDRAFQYRRDVAGRIVPAPPGSFVRPQAWFEAVPPDRLRLGGRDERGGTFIGACEDLEALFYLQNSRWEIWHAPALWVEHHLPPRRLEPDYLAKVALTSGLSNHALRLARLGIARRGEMRWRVGAYFLSDGWKLAVRLLRTHSQRHHPPIACDRAAHWEIGRAHV